MVHDQRAILAANNNADFYEAVFASWDLRYRRDRFAFVGEDPPPPYYSNLTILSPGHRDEVLTELRSGARRFGGAVGFKDSFSEFDLADHGFRALFEASWFWKSHEAGRRPERGWSLIQDGKALVAWEGAWKRFGSPTRLRMFRDALLDRPELKFWGKTAGDEVVAGCIANLSRDCIGISNLFFAPNHEDAFREATAAVASLDEHRPIVGYAAGPRLTSALAAGFEATGTLRVVVAKNARFEDHDATRHES